MDLRHTIREHADLPLPRQLILSWLKDYKRPFDKMVELTKQGALMQLKRGLYIAGEALEAGSPEPFLIANILRGPSYVSFESALSYHGMIPERVYEIHSATVRETKQYQTPFRRFVYTHISTPYFSFGIERKHLAERQSALVASKEKALTDLVIKTPGLKLRSIKQTKAFLMDDLRIDEEMLRLLDTSALRTYLPEAPKSDSIEILIKTLDTL